jgi:hypothetical protein
LFGFNPGKSDKLVVTLSHENGTIREVTYGGVRMSLAVRSGNHQFQQTAIYYLDKPGVPGDLAVTFSGEPNGVGGSLLALSNTAPGAPTYTGSAAAKVIQLNSKTAERSFLIASHACNDNAIQTGTALQPPLTPLFDGPTGSSLGGSGYLNITSVARLTAAFASRGERPVTAAAVFAPLP